MPLTIPVAHDFICPWCWVGLAQAKRLIADFGVEIEWNGYELWPRELDWPLPTMPTPPVPNKPETPSRLDFILYADGLTLPPVVKPTRMRTFNAHEALEHAKHNGKGFEFCEALYNAYWVDGLNINQIDVLKELASKNGLDAEQMATEIELERYKEFIVAFDDPAHAKGVWNVPTFFIGGERYAEQPYVVLEKAVKAALSSQ